MKRGQKSFTSKLGVTGDSLGIDGSFMNRGRRTSISIEAPTGPSRSRRGSAIQMPPDVSSSKLKIRSENSTGGSRSASRAGSKIKLNKEDSSKGSKMKINKEDSIKELKRRDSVKKKSGKSRRTSGVTADQLGIPGLNNDKSRRGSTITTQSKAVTRRQTALVYNSEHDRIKYLPNQIVLLGEIQDPMHIFRMVHFSGETRDTFSSPLHDLETLVIPDTRKNTKSVLELLADIYQISLFSSYQNALDYTLWARSSEKFEDILQAFGVDYQGEKAFDILLTSFSREARWKIITRAMHDFLVLFPKDRQTDLISGDREAHIKRQVVSIISGCTWSIRNTHQNLCNEIDQWFGKYSKKQWTESKIPVHYGPFHAGVDILGPFLKLRHRLPTLDLLSIKGALKAISKGLLDFPIQREFISLALIRQLYEFLNLSRIMENLFTVAVKLQIHPETIFNALNSFPFNDPKNTRFSAFEKIDKTKEECKEKFSELLSASNVEEFLDQFAALKSKIAKEFSALEAAYGSKMELATIYPLDAPIYCLDVDAREKRRRTVKSFLLAELEKKKPPAIAVPTFQFDDEPSVTDSNKREESFLRVEESDTGTDNFSLKALQRKLKLVAAQDGEDDMEDLIKVVESDLSLEETVPGNVQAEFYAAGGDAWDTIEILYDESFGSIGWKDLEFVLQLIGCKITSMGGLENLISHPKITHRVIIRRPHPDLFYKSHEMDKIRCIFEDHLGIYFQHFKNEE